MKKYKVGDKVTMTFPVSVKKVDKENYTMRAVVSTQSEDRHGDVVVQSGYDFKNFLKNPVILNSHNYGDATEVIGKAISVEQFGKGKRARTEMVIKFAVEENPKRAKVIFDLYAAGFLNTFSVGFKAKAFETDKNGVINWSVITEAELLEVSAVSVPANAQALAKAKGIDIDALNSKNNGDNQEDNEDEEDDEPEPAGDSDDSEDGEEEGNEEDKGSEGDSGSEDDSQEDEEEEIDDEKEEVEEEGVPDTFDEEKAAKEEIKKAVKGIEEKRKKGLIKARSIINSMLNGDVEAKRVDAEIKEKIRKRKVNQAVRELLKNNK